MSAYDARERRAPAGPFHFPRRVPAGRSKPRLLACSASLAAKLGDTLLDTQATAKYFAVPDLPSVVTRFRPGVWQP